MDDPLVLWLIISVLAALAATVLLVVMKLIHRMYLRWQGARMAHYIAAIGEMVSRKLLPERPAPGWARDPLFHRALAEYRLSLVGSERGFIDDLVEYLGVLDVLVDRIGKPFRPSARLASVATFVDLATESYVDDLRGLLGDPSHHIAIHAAKGLSRLRDIPSVAPILDRAVEASPWHAARLADALVGYGPVVGPPARAWIERSIDDPQPPIKTVALAVRVLGQVSDPAAEDLLVSILASDQPQWRVAAASALGFVGGNSAATALISALSDRHWPVRARAAASLGHLAVASATDQLRPLLNDEMWWVRQNAAEAIGRLPGGTEVLVKALSGNDPFAADAALYQLTLQGAVVEAARRSRTGKPTRVDVDLLAHVGNLPIDAQPLVMGLTGLESVL
ncbi:MAG: HEAT repeat domain-containing protein [Acidimicrobiia bacterium]